MLLTPIRKLGHGLFLLLTTAWAAGAGADVESVRLWEGPDKTRAVFDLDGPVDYRVFTLDSPHRVVVDLDDVTLEPDAGLPVPGGRMIEAIRTGRRNGDDLRIVFDLAHPGRPKSFLIPPVEQYGHRLVIDLFRADAAAPVRKVEDVARSERDIVVAIDAGHGGEDPGAIGASGTREKDVVLAVAKEIDAMLDGIAGFRGELVRTGDYFVPLAERPARARELGADLFVSIHADGFYDRRARGSSVFVLSNRRASSEAARWLADRENRSDLVGGVKLGDKDEMLAAVLLDLSQSASMEASTRAADAVFAAIASIGRTHKRHVESASFAVLTSPDIPSLLVETAFITNPEEEKRLKSKLGRTRIAQAIADGIVEYFESSPPPGTRVARHGVVRNRHVVSRGETLSEIARRHRVSLNRLRAANRIEGDLVRVGEVLTIPTG